MKPYLTRNEAAEMLGVHPQTISNYLSKGLLVESQTRNPNSRAMRILSSSVQNLLAEGYDIIEQYKAIEVCQKDVMRMREEFARERDELEKAHSLMLIRDKFYNNVREVAEILSAYLKGNDVLKDIRQEYLIDLLSGKRWEYISWKKGVTKASIRSIYVKALRALADAQMPSITELKHEIHNLKTQLKLERKRNELLDGLQAKSVTDDEVLEIMDERVIKIPNSLVGFKHIPMSVRLHNILRAADLEHVYELALINRDAFFKMRNCGRKTFNEAELLVEKLGLEFNNVESLNGQKIQSMSGPYTELTIGALKARSRELKARFA